VADARVVRICELAQGGMGRVDLVARRDGSFERLYAMKRLHAHLAADVQCRAMFVDEARIAGLVRHANVVSVIDVGEDEQGPYLLMDYVDGVPLTSVIKREIERDGRLALALCLDIAAQVARGLHAAHELADRDGRPLGVVHRDVSPQNILVGFDGVVRVTDFGIAKALDQSSHTAAGILKGKLGYVAPEQLRFEAVDRRTDLYALGVVLYELLAGKRLHGGDANETARRVLDDAPPDIGDERDETPPEVVELLFELLAKDPALRPARAHDVARRLDAARKELEVLPDAPGLGEWMEEAFGDRRDASRRRLDAAAADLRATEPEVARLVTEMSVTRRAAPSRRSWFGAVLAAAVLGVAGWMVVRTNDVPAEVGSATPVVPAPASAVPPAPATVSVSVETEPNGAAIFVDGERRGETPAQIELPRSSAKHELRLQLDGFRDRIEPIAADVNQRLVLPLERARPAGVRPPPKVSTPPPTPTGSAGGFRRYD
jgi:serine/threonine-protein kinase